MVKTYQDLKEKTLGMVAFFETSNTYPDCYGVTAGNWDDAGISHGVLQYNFKAGSLQPLWNHMNNNYNDLCRGIFGTDYAEWSSMINADLTTQRTWGTEIGDPATGRHSCLQPWKDYFMELGKSQPSIDKQIDMSSSWHVNALKWFNNLGLYSRRGYALMFDISVQMGRFFPQNVCLHRFRQIDPTGKTRAQIEEEKLRIIVELCANGNNKTFNNPNVAGLEDLQGIVYRRKIGIVDGTSPQGLNMSIYDLEYDEPAFKGGIFSGIPDAEKPIVEVTNLYNAVKLDWEPTKNTSSYKIYRTNDIATLGPMLQEIPATTTTFTDSTAISGNIYYYTVKAVNEFDATNSDKAIGNPSDVMVYDNRLVDFTGYTAWTVYDGTAVTNDFGNVNTLQGGDRLKIDTSERLRFYLPAGQLGTANTGGLIKAKVAGKNEYTFEYEIRFDSGFPWSKGGKVAGMSGGKGYTGGEGDLARTLGDGWSVRMMWREGGRIIPYVYHAGMAEGELYGDTFGKTLGYFTDTKAHIIKYYIKLNTGANFDGILKIWMDGNEILNMNDICYRRDDSQIDTAHLAIFAGGSTEDWNMTADGYIRLSYVKWE
jgi:hypothetical protein